MASGDLSLRVIGDAARLVGQLATRPATLLLTEYLGWPWDARRLYLDRLITGGPPPAGPRMEVAWMGTAGLFVTDGETGFFIDPFVSRHGVLRCMAGFPLPPMTDLVDVWVERLEAGHAGAVLASHSHCDHAMDAPWFASRTGAVLVGSESTANVGRGAGMAEERLRVIRGGEVFETGRFRITFIESRHGKALFGRVPFPGEIASPLRPPARASDYREGGTFSILVEHPCGSFVHNGSAGWVEGMFDDVRADVLFLGLAGRETTIGLIENLVRPLAPRMVVPFHFDDFFTGLDETMGFLAGVGFEEFVAVIEREMPGLRLATLPIGRRIAILPVTPSCCR